MSLEPPQIPHGPAWDWTQAWSVRSWLQTARAIAEPGPFPVLSETGFLKLFKCFKILLF